METNDLGEDDDVTDIPKITIGLCAMNKKVRVLEACYFIYCSIMLVDVAG